jgi:hypothetical protein
MTAGVLLRYAGGGEVYGLLNTVPGALLSVRVAGVDIIPPLRGPHAITACDDGALLTAATLTQLVEATPHARRIADEAAEHERVALEMKRPPTKAKRTGKGRAKR